MFYRRRHLLRYWSGWATYWEKVILYRPPEVKALTTLVSVLVDEKIGYEKIVQGGCLARDMRCYEYCKKKYPTLIRSMFSPTRGGGAGLHPFTTIEIIAH